MIEKKGSPNIIPFRQTPEMTKRIALRHEKLRRERAEYARRIIKQNECDQAEPNIYKDRLSGIDLEVILDNHKIAPQRYKAQYIFAVATEYLKRLEQSPDRGAIDVLRTGPSESYKNLLSLDKERRDSDILQKVSDAFDELQEHVMEHPELGIRPAEVMGHANAYWKLSEEKRQDEIKNMLKPGLRGIEENRDSIEKSLGFYIAHLDLLSGDD
ncbi:MAG: hypothetical protein UY39_C0050G0005 [Candidatus Kaiserbacteria bacterium GW2011_GWC2_49_12]|uniref:Uncharacterized protein n=1 Tax=Candidatus Kaiserbacteria bacterium GW2011_GWC2_49_12 TaxID=1618675 RepID=A0A0G1YHA6_9BACT|nr:MAG: hypothetical protein UY39_C0050G0005 [Candidatus Kaiserbacteria bacterium GW2011_GWC2_49_12]HCM43501.1 hypothetical protein [Candidatus Kaiserbacteria bacterium]